MKVRTTSKMLVARFKDWRQGNSAGPADVYYKRDDFTRVAKIYGWGENVAPNQIVYHMGDRVSLFDVLYFALCPARVRYL